MSRNARRWWKPRAVLRRVGARSVAPTLAFVVLASCASDPLSRLTPGDGPAVSDATLYSLATADDAWTYYKRSAVPIARQSSAHPERTALVRYNAAAATQLNEAGQVRRGATFPDSSLIVKALSNGAGVVTYAVMLKLRSSASAGVGGWVWAEFGPDGAVRYSTTGRGGGCAGCHDVGIDYTRMNDTHP